MRQDIMAILYCDLMLLVARHVKNSEGQVREENFAWYPLGRQKYRVPLICSGGWVHRWDSELTRAENGELFHTPGSAHWCRLRK